MCGASRHAVPVHRAGARIRLGRATIARVRAAPTSRVTLALDRK
jgi:hypothetical protein